jgi:putative transposase
VIRPAALSGRWHVPSRWPFDFWTRLSGFPASCQSHESIISDNGPQFVAREFREFIRIVGMTPVRTTRNRTETGALDRSQEDESIQPGTPLLQQDAERLIQQYMDHYNNVRLHSAIGYVTPMDMPAGRLKEIQIARDRKLEEAHQKRQLRCGAAAIVETLRGELT